MNQSFNENKREIDLYLYDKYKKVEEIIKRNNGSVMIEDQGQWTMDLGDEKFSTTPSPDEIAWKARKNEP